MEKRKFSFLNYFFPLAVILTIFLVSFFVLKPRVFEVIKTQGKLKEQKKLLSQLTTKVASLEGLDEAGLITRSDWLLKILPVEKNIDTFLVDFKNLSSQSGVRLTEVSASPGEMATASGQSKSKEDLPSESYGIVIEASLDQLKAFIQNVEKSAPLLRVDEVSFSQQQGGVQSATLKLLSYYLPLPEKLGELESPLIEITAEENQTFQKLSSFEALPRAEGQEELIPFTGRNNPFVF